jgi:hypothetical protein
MTLIQKIIKEEINRFSGPKLNIFDFDDTLVSDYSFVYVIRPNGERIQLDPKAYRSYKPAPDESVDISEFDLVKDPIPNLPLINLLKSLQGSSIILTARTAHQPIEDYMINQFGITVPVYAVGTTDPKLISSSYNAKRKAEWISKILSAFQIDEIELWDDNKLNIREIGFLSKTFPVKIKSNLVKFDPRS